MRRFRKLRLFNHRLHLHNECAQGAIYVSLAASLRRIASAFPITLEAVPRPKTKSSYNCDFFAWTQETARAIEENRFEDIDRHALADEVSTLGKRDRREIVSRLTTLTAHLLKLKYQPEKETKSWWNTINRERRELDLILTDSPSLKAQLPQLLAEAYRYARIDAANETGINIAQFPHTCEWSVSEVIY